MSVKHFKPVIKGISIVLIHSFSVWIMTDLLNPGFLYSQTTAADYLDKGIEHTENFEFDEAIKNLNKALEIGENSTVKTTAHDCDHSGFLPGGEERNGHGQISFSGNSENRSQLYAVLHRIQDFS